MRIPSNYKQLLKDNKALTDYFLKPYGYDIPVNLNMPRAPQVTKFLNKTFTLVRPGNQVKPNILSFKTTPQWAKPDIKQYFQKLYGMKIQDVRTARFMGKVIRTQDSKYKRTRAYKKVYLALPEKVEPFLQSTK